MNHKSLLRAAISLSLLLAMLTGSASFAATIGATQNVSNDPAHSIRPRVAQDPDGNLHVVWDSQDGDGPRQVRYVKGVWSGTTYSFGQSSVLAEVGQYGYALPNLAVAPNGTIVVAWSDGTLRARAWDARASQPGGQPVALGAGLAPSIEADSRNRFHIAWSGDFKAQYCVFNGTACERRETLSTEKTNRPDVAVDKDDNVHLVWDEGNQVLYKARPANGNWGATETLDTNGANLSQIAADGQGNVHVVWSKNYDIQYCRRIFGGGCAERHTIDAGSDLEPFIGATRSGNVIIAFRESNSKRIFVDVRERGVWSGPAALGPGIQIDVTQRGYVERASIAWSHDYDIQVTTITTAPPLSGTLVLNNGASLTNQPAVQARITNTSSTVATTYSLADGSDPGAPMTAFTNPALTTTFNLNVSDGRCRAHTVYGRLGNAGAISPIFSASIIYDPSVSAIAQARNPHAPFNLPLNGFTSAAVPDGDLAYTREQRFNLAVSPSSEECSGLKRYAIVARGAPAPAADSPLWTAFPAEGYLSANVQFQANAYPDHGGQGTYRFDVYLEDRAGNRTTQPYPVQVIYDSTAPAINGVSDPLPTAPSSKGGVVTLTVGTPAIDDNLYTDPASGLRYWGYWVVVKPSGDGAPSELDWNAWGVIKQGPLPSSLRWNMADGMVGTWRAFAPNSNYTVYLRALDGAGNASNAIAGQPVQVKQLEFFTQLPLVRR